MNLNRLHNIFGRRGRLDRRDIEEYARTEDPATRNAIEQKAAADGFGADALEGWSEMNYDTAAMASLDKKFIPKSYGAWYAIGGTLVVATIATVVYFGWFNEKPNETLVADNNTTEVITELMEDQQITLDEADVMIPAPIELMHVAPEPEQMQPAAIIHDFQEINASRDEDPPVEVAELPILDIDISKVEDQEIIRAHEFAKEIYLHDLKLVDYRNYRTKPQVKTRQMVLSGTPANKEDENSPDIDPIWKEVSIPYMEYIEKSIRIFGRGNYKRALSRFETVTESYPTDVNANFYAGLCLYNLGEYQLAIENFDNCLFGPYSNFDEEAEWMKALCLEHGNDHSKAGKLFEKIAQQNGFYATQAREKLR